MRSALLTCIALALPCVRLFAAEPQHPKDAIEEVVVNYLTEKIDRRTGK